MPKKRTHNFKQLQGASSSSGNNGANKTPSVNERLNELRLLGGKDATKKKAELAATVNQRSVLPPELRRILGVPDTAPPKPKRATRSRMPNRTPGPAPPASWTKTPGWTPALSLRTGKRRFRKAGSTDIARSRPEQLMRFARMAGLQSEYIDEKPSSLVHFALKSAAENWDLFDEEDLPALTELPLPLRLRLISYLGFYGPAIGAAVLDALTASSPYIWNVSTREGVPSGSATPLDEGEESVTYLDLAGLIGHGSLTVARLTKLAKPPPPNPETSPDDVTESWEASFEAVLEPHMPVSRLTSLSHLSLSHPPGAISWKDLLSLSKHIPNVTHLSLAYWPRPTLTPNLATTTVSSQYSPDMTAGGSHFYSVLDEDLYEPASVLRSLSGHLLRLTWLDLEGCSEWVPALAYYKDTDIPTDPSQRFDDGWTSESMATSIFIQNWKNMTYLNCSQGWTPTLSSLQSLPRQSMSLTKRTILKTFEDTLGIALLSLSEEPEDLTIVAQHRAESWLQLEERAFTAERRINTTRRSNAIKFVDFDHGWGRKAV